MFLINSIILICLISSINGYHLADYAKIRQKRSVQEVAINYLKKYDYITAEQLASPASDKYFKDALKRCQNLLGLEPTGSLNPETVEIVGKPRCGRSDIYNVRSKDLTPWTNQTITYSLVTSSIRFPHADLKRTMREAFNAWEDFIPRRFEEVDTEAAADIKVRFGRLDHGDGKPFDGPGGELAHATVAGILHFDDDEIFKRYTRAEAITDLTLKDIFWVAIHEAGHVLGLDHIKDYPSIMRPIFAFSRDVQGNYVEPNLEDLDITKAQEIYGGKTRPKIDTTTVANGGLYTAYAIVQKDREYLRSTTFEFFQTAQRAKWNLTEIPFDIPFTEIVSGAFKAFNPQATPNAMVYVTIFTHDIATGNVMKIVDAYEIVSNRGVVIAADNRLNNATPEKIWIDQTGKDHSRRPKNV